MTDERGEIPLTPDPEVPRGFVLLVDGDGIHKLIATLGEMRLPSGSVAQTGYRATLPAEEIEAVLKKLRQRDGVSLAAVQLASDRIAAEDPDVQRALTSLLHERPLNRAERRQAGQRGPGRWSRGPSYRG